MSQASHNLNRQRRSCPRAYCEPSVTSITSPRSALPVAIIAGAVLVDVNPGRHQTATTCESDTEDRAAGSRTSSFEQKSLWSKKIIPLQTPHQEQTFGISLETSTVDHGSQALSAHHQKADPVAAVPVITPNPAIHAKRSRESQAPNGFQVQAELMRYPTTRSRLAASNPDGIPLQPPIVVNRAVPEYCNPFSKHANLGLEDSSERRFRTWLIPKPGVGEDTGDGYNPARAEPPIKLPPLNARAAEVQCAPSAQYAPSVPTNLIVPPDPVAGEVVAPIGRTTLPDTVIAAQAYITEDIVDVAQPQHLHHQAGPSTGFHSRVGTTNLATNTEQHSAREDGFRTPPGLQSILPPRFLRPLVQSALRSPLARTSDLSILSQMEPSPTRSIPAPLLYPVSETAPKTLLQLEISVSSEKCQMTPHGTNTTPAMNPQLYKTEDRERSATHRVTPSRDHSNSEVDSLPASPRSHGGSVENDYDTPMTSPCSSPVKASRATNHLPRLEHRTRQLDGAWEGNSDAEARQNIEADHQEATSEFPNTSNETPNITKRFLRSSWDLQSASLISKDDRIPNSNDGVGSPASTSDHAFRTWQADTHSDEVTPLGPASPAKGANSFPFPAHAGNDASTSPLSTSRRPSALLRHCERNATPRQRRLMVSGLQTPDRFIPSRTATPTKETLLLARPKARVDRSEKPLLSADPFGPLPSRSLRTIERYATTRSPPTPSRPVGMIGSRVLDTQSSTARAASAGTIWTVGGSVVTEGVASISNGRGGRVTSGTSATHYTADFLRKHSSSEEEVTHGRRLALAMDIDQSAKMLEHSSPSSPRSPQGPSSGESGTTRVWNNGVWEHDGVPTPTKSKPKKDKDVPIIPFRVLDAPALRDDYYCSLLAYSTTLKCLAVGLGAHVYLWSENRGSRNIPDSLTAPYGSAHVTSVSFSSREGGSAILAIGRADGRITLWSPLDRDPRFDSEQPAPVSCVSFRPTTVRRPSLRDPAAVVATEELLVGDEVGYVYYYSIQWPTQDERDLFDWHGSMTLLARLTCHLQQVCGIAWGPDGAFFATGGNDNQMFLFESKKILKRSNQRNNAGGPTVHVRDGSSASTSATLNGQGEVITILPGREKHIFTLNAAVKAIAFAPWQSTLLAAGGGSNDRCIHFFHTLSGANLATIECHAQVTSLVWSDKRKEIASTFGFAQPEHPYRVAVFAWPSCDMVVRIPWWSEERALFAVAYPRGPRGGQSQDAKSAGASGDRPAGERRLDAEGRPWYGKRTKEEGCLVVATSDASIKFHEIWTESRSTGGKRIPSGVLGGSQILEEECSGDIERWTVIR